MEESSPVWCYEEEGSLRMFMRPVFWQGMWGRFASSAYGWDTCFGEYSRMLPEAEALPRM